MPLSDHAFLEGEHYAVDNNGCWLWLGTLDKQGYGHAAGQRAHRATYAAAHGPIPPGSDVHHRCEIKACVNPAHLELKTRSEHIREHWAQWASTTDEIRAQIRELARNPRISARQLSERFGVPRPTVNKIVHGYSWFAEPVQVERPRCLHCDKPIESGPRHKTFCNASCRGTYNNRRRRANA